MRKEKRKKERGRREQEEEDGGRGLEVTKLNRKVMISHAEPGQMNIKNMHVSTTKQPRT